jgi:glycine/D-amino acid oxidase-like deaminating enzyme
MHRNLDTINGAVNRVFLANHDPSGLARVPYLAAGGMPVDAGPLQDDDTADVVVVGAGIAGCSLALHAAPGARVVVLEAKEVGWGASSRNSGHVAPATKLEPDAILSMYGEERGRRVIATSRAGPKLVFDLAERHGIDISLERAGILTAAHTRGAMIRLERRVSTLRRLGYEVDLLDRGATSQVVGSEPRYYLGSVLDHDGGAINPLAYVRGLAHAAIRAGAKFHQGTKALRLGKSTKPGGKRWRVETEHGHVEADVVVLCTNGYTDDLWPGLRDTVVPVRAYQFMTVPIDERCEPPVLPTRVCMTDTRRLMSGVRKHRDSRLHFSGIGPLFGPEQVPDFALSCGRIDRMFPQLRGIKLDYWWSGWMAMNSESSWKLHEMAPGALAVLGCNGRGVALATLLGRDLAKRVLGQSMEDNLIPFSRLRSIRAYSMHKPLVRALVSYYRFRDSVDDAFRPRPERPGTGALRSK